MYRKGKAYDELDKLVIDIYVDYEIKEFPINVKKLCDKMGVLLIPYSEYGKEEKEILLKKSIHGFLVPPCNNKAAKIYYNDESGFSEGTIRQTILHEIKHYVCEDYYEETPIDDDLAEHFARYFACPTPFLVKNNITDVDEIISKFATSFSIATYVSRSIQNRMCFHGQEIFEYEKALINLFDK